MKSCIICCVPAQILYLEKSCSWHISQNALSQWDSRIFKWTMCPERSNDTASFFGCWYKFMKIKSWLKIVWLGMFKNGCDQSGLWTLKLIVSEEWIDEINRFFACWYKFIRIKSCLKIFEVGMVKNERGQSGHETLKFNVSQKWKHGINWFFECCYKFRKAKSWFNDF